MPTQTLALLNEQFGRAERIVFHENPHGFPIATLTNRSATATVALDGGQVLTYQPADQPPVLFVSREAVYTQGKSVRGGIPVCWPWFAGVRDDPERPFHGFARMMRWEVLETTDTEAATTLVLGLRPSEATRRYWPHAFDLRLAVSVGRQLRTDLVTTNTDSVPIELTAALHTYFHVGDVTHVAVYGLEGTHYSDKRDEGREKTQSGPVTFSGPTDRIYRATSATCVIDDPTLDRRLVIEKHGSNSTVVWNPWAEDARAMRDMAEDEYQVMLCVETTNAADDRITLAPGATHTLGAQIGSEARGSA